MNDEATTKQKLVAAGLRAPLMGRTELEEENKKLRELVFFYADEAGYSVRHVIATLKEEGIRPPKRVRKKKGE